MFDKMFTHEMEETLSSNFPLMENLEEALISSNVPYMTLNECWTLVSWLLGAQKYRGARDGPFEGCK